MNGNGLHERMKNLREKVFLLVDMENLEMEGILNENISEVVKIMFCEIVQ